MKRQCLVLCGWLALAGCGSSAPSGGGGTADGGGSGTADSGGIGSADGSAGGAPDGGDVSTRYFPMVVGATWTYDVTKTVGVSGKKTQQVMAVEDVGGDKAGVTAFRVRSDKPSGKWTVSWQQDTGDALVRHREKTFAADGTQETDEFYAPRKLRLDESAAHVKAGVSFTDTYTEKVHDLVAGSTVTVTKTETWTIEAVDARITVPAGTFTCLKVHRTNAKTGSDKRYWFARGVGKVREEGAGQTEALRSYSIP